jgi:hypothetical protein
MTTVTRNVQKRQKIHCTLLAEPICLGWVAAEDVGCKNNHISNGSRQMDEVANRTMV